MTEIMDFVDEMNNIIGRDTRENIKTRKLNYRIVHIWVFNKEHKLMVCRRPLNRKNYLGLWTSSAGGHVKAGENYKEAAEREVKEELGIETDLKHAFTFNYIHPRGSYVFIDLWTSYNSLKLNKINLDKNEIEEIKFLSVEELSKEVEEKPELFNPQFIRLIKKWISHQKEK